MKAIPVDTSGTAPAAGSYTTLLASGWTGNSDQRFVGSASGANGRFVVAYCDANDSNKPKLLVGLMGNSTIVDRGNAIGVVTAGASSGSTATIALLGSNATGLSGLTPGAMYYIQANGTLGTTVTAYYYGTATSSTSLLSSAANSSGATVTVNESVASKVQSASGKTSVQTEFSSGDESVRVYANGSSSFYADGHTDSSLNIDRGLIYTTVAIGNLASGGAIGTAATTVDMGTAFAVAQTTSGQTLTLPSPTNVKAGRLAYLINTGSVSFTAYGSTVAAGASVVVVWNGSAWAGYSAPPASTATTATNLAGGVAGAVHYQSAAGATGFSAAGTSGQVLLSGGTGAPTWSSNISGNAANVTGIVGVANGGTGTSTGSITGPGALTFAAGGSNQNLTLTPSGSGYTLLNGNVGLGTTTPAYKLDISGSAHTTGDVYADGWLYCRFGGVYYLLNGGGTNGATATWNTSDARLKKDITTIPKALDTLKQFQGVTWNWNENGLQHLTRDLEKNWKAPSGTAEDNQKLWAEKRQEAREKLAKPQMGFIAQEVEKVFPDWVQTDESGFKQVNMERLNALLVNAIKEQQATIEGQQATILTLTNDLDNLKALVAEILRQQRKSK